MIEDKKYTVYRHITPSGKVYIGITGQKPEKRWQNGNGYKDNEHFYRAILKYGWENIKHEIICQAPMSAAQAGAVEKSFIHLYDSTNPDKGYNHTIGGEYGTLGMHHSVESRKKMSKSHKGKTSPRKGVHLSAETRRKLSKSHKGINHPNYGKHLNDETRQKISEAQKGKHHSVEARKKMSEARKGKTSPRKGVHLGPETRQKLSESHKGVHPSTETRQKMSESIKRAYIDNPELRRKQSESNKGVNNPYYGKHHSAETRRKLSESHKGQIPWNRKAVICVETGISYSSCTEAAESIGVTSKAISNALRGKSKTSGGYHWKYVEA